MSTVDRILAIEGYLEYLACHRVELADNPIAAAAVDVEHRRLDNERMEMKMLLTPADDVLLELRNGALEICVFQ